MLKGIIRLTLLINGIYLIAFVVKLDGDNILMAIVAGICLAFFMGLD